MKRISKLVGANVAMCVLMIGNVENAAYLHVIFQTKLRGKTVKNFGRKMQRYLSKLRVVPVKMATNYGRKLKY